MIYVGISILCLTLCTVFIKGKSQKKKKKRTNCPTCSLEGRCTQGCKKNLSDLY